MMRMYINAKCHPDEIIVHTDFVFFVFFFFGMCHMYMYMYILMNVCTDRVVKMGFSYS